MQKTNNKEALDSYEYSVALTPSEKNVLQVSVVQEFTAIIQAIYGWSPWCYKKSGMSAWAGGTGGMGEGRRGRGKGEG